MNRTLLRVGAAFAAISALALVFNGVAVLERHQPDPFDGLPEAGLWWVGAALVIALSFVAILRSPQSRSRPGGFPVFTSVPHARERTGPAPTTFRIRDGGFNFESSSERDFLLALALRAGQAFDATPDLVRVDLRPADEAADDLPEAVITISSLPGQLSDEQFDHWAGVVQFNLWRVYPAGRFVPAALTTTIQADGSREASFNVLGVVS